MSSGTWKYRQKQDRYAEKGQVGIEGYFAVGTSAPARNDAETRQQTHTSIYQVYDKFYMQNAPTSTSLVLRPSHRTTHTFANAHLQEKDCIKLESRSMCGLLHNRSSIYLQQTPTLYRGLGPDKNVQNQIAHIGTKQKDSVMKTRVCLRLRVVSSDCSYGNFAQWFGCIVAMCRTIELQ